jgi:hypothetical protein
MHDQNILVRPGSQELVIVDVGMFRSGKKMAKKWRRGQPPRYERDVTVMQERFPHGGQPYGGQRKQDAEAEHAGHVERSKHQGLRNVMDEIDSIIDEELEAVMDEKKKKKRKKRKKAGTESSKESSLRDWFGRKGAKGKKKGWVDCNAPDGKGGYKSCGRSTGEKRKKYPACRPTPGACKERGKGKSWGKKAKKRGKKK